MDELQSVGLERTRFDCRLLSRRTRMNDHPGVIGAAWQ